MNSHYFLFFLRSKSDISGIIIVHSQSQTISSIDFISNTQAYYDNPRSDKLHFPPTKLYPLFNKIKLKRQSDI